MSPYNAKAFWGDTSFFQTKLIKEMRSKLILTPFLIPLFYFINITFDYGFDWSNIDWFAYKLIHQTIFFLLMFITVNIRKPKAMKWTLYISLCYLLWLFCFIAIDIIYYGLEIHIAKVIVSSILGLVLPFEQYLRKE